MSSENEYSEAANNALELIRALAGGGRISDSEFLDGVAKTDAILEHDIETCGICYQRFIGAQIAREMIDAGIYEDVVTKWAEETEKRWQDSKYFKLWRSELEAGRDPRKAFEEQGWEP